MQLKLPVLKELQRLAAEALSMAPLLVPLRRFTH